MGGIEGGPFGKKTTGEKTALKQRRKNILGENNPPQPIRSGRGPRVQKEVAASVNRWQQIVSKHREEENS